MAHTEQRRSGETDIWFYCAKDITDGGSCQHLQDTGAPSAKAAPTPHTQILGGGHDPQKCPPPQDSKELVVVVVVVVVAFKKLTVQW